METKVEEKVTAKEVLLVLSLSIFLILATPLLSIYFGINYWVWLAIGLLSALIIDLDSKARNCHVSRRVIMFLLCILAGFATLALVLIGFCNGQLKIKRSYLNATIVAFFYCLLLKKILPAFFPVKADCKSMGFAIGEQNAFFIRVNELIAT